MYELKRGVAVDIATEIDAMVRHTVTRWDNVPDLKPLFELAYQSAAHDARFWFDPYALSEVLHDKADERVALMRTFCAEDEADLLWLYDNCAALYRGASSGASHLMDVARHADGKWDFSDRADKVYEDAVQLFGSLSNMRPKGWDELAQGYVDFDGMSEYDPADARAFEGADTASAGADGFSGRIALPYVMYDEFCQGRKAPRMLVSSAYAHFLQILQHLNTEAMLKELAGLDFRENELKPVFGLRVTSRNALVATLLQIVVEGADGRSLASEAEYLKTLADRHAFAQKSPEEQEVTRAENAARMDDIVANLGNQNDDYEVRRKKKDEYILQTLFDNVKRLAVPQA
jgi:hypothetical protein